MPASLLQTLVSGFRPGEKTLLNVSYLESGKSVYHRYEGGSTWMATAPNDAGHEGQNLTILPKLLTRGEFMTSMPDIIMKNEAGFSWLPSRSRILDLSDAGNPHFEVEQVPASEGISRFSVSVQPSEKLGFVPGWGCHLEMGIGDFFGRSRKLRVYHDGHYEAWLGLRRGKRYPRITLVSYDGVRLRLAYGSPEIRVASIYLADPAQLYSIEKDERRGPIASKNSLLAPLSTYKTRLRRETEREMLMTRYRYPHGRLGSEIAYSIARNHMGIEDLILNDPSEGGRT